MPVLYVELKLDQPVGSRLPAQVIAEIQAVAPSVVVANSINAAKLQADCVTTPKILDGNVTSAKIAAAGVETVNIKDGAVVTAKMADNSVTKAKAGTGVITGSYSDGSPATFDVVPLTAAEYAGRTPVAGTVYLVLA